MEGNFDIVEMASIAISLPIPFLRSRSFLLERAVPYLACVPLAYFIYDRLPASIKAKVILDAKTGLIKQTFIMTWLKQVGVDRVVLRDLHVRYQALHVLDKASYSPSFHAACLAMVTKVVNTQAFTEAGKASMFDISAVVLNSEEEVLRQIKEAFTASTMESIIASGQRAQKTGTASQQKGTLRRTLLAMSTKQSSKHFF